MRRNVFTTYDPNLPSGKKFVAVHVQHEDPLYFLVDVKSKVCDLFTQITKFLNLFECELFGLSIKCCDSHIFLDPLEKLSKYAPKQWKTQNNGMNNDGVALFNVYFRVQYYVDSYLFISDKVAKILYYHQMKENVITYGQSLCEERAFLLASYALQADYGNYNNQIHKANYFNPMDYFPNWVIAELGVEYIVRHLPALHCDHKGMSRSEAQSIYIKESSDSIAPHNFHFYKLACKKSSSVWEDLWLAVTISGIAIYANEAAVQSSPAGKRPQQQQPQQRQQQAQQQPQNVVAARIALKTRISFFPWPDIGKLSFEKKKFEIRSTGPQSRKFVYYAPNEIISRHLLWFSRATHQFHLMVQNKMREMLKREKEITRRKYRESCISSLASSTGSSSGNSSVGSGSSAVPSSGSNSTSKSASPFEMFGPVDPKAMIARPVGVRLSVLADLNTSASSQSTDTSADTGRSTADQRESVISNASSNTTSGIVSDKTTLDESDREEDDEHNMLMSLDHHDDHLNDHLNHHHHHLNHLHHHHHHRHALHQPVVSLESLAMSEPIDGQIHRNSKSQLMSQKHKKHSISIGNIVISAGDSPQTDSCDEMAGDSASCSTSVSPTSVRSSDHVMIDPKNSQKVSLCMYINDKRESDAAAAAAKGNNNNNNNNNNSCCNSPYTKCSDEEASIYDEVDSVLDSTCKSYTSGKSNVTVLSTILKPEAERLLKRGMDSDETELLFDDGIDSIELAELKEFEQAEKEKFILNSLINKLPPPPIYSESSNEDDDDDDEDNYRSACSGRSCYSPLNEEEKRLRYQSSPAKSSGVDSSMSYEDAKTHHYENVQALGLPGVFRSTNDGFKSLPANKIPIEVNYASPVLRAAPSLNSMMFAPATPTRYQHRPGMRIGVSSLTRPYNSANRARLVLGPGYGQPTHAGTGLPVWNGGLFDSCAMIAASEPNIYLQTTQQCQQWPTSGPQSLHTPVKAERPGLVHRSNTTATPKTMKSDSVSNLAELRKRMADLDSPLITALLNDLTLHDHVNTTPTSGSAAFVPVNRPARTFTNL